MEISIKLVELSPIIIQDTKLVVNKNGKQYNKTIKTPAIRGRVKLIVNKGLILNGRYKSQNTSWICIESNEGHSIVVNEHTTMPQFTLPDKLQLVGLTLSIEQYMQ